VRLKNFHYTMNLSLSKADLLALDGASPVSAASPLFDSSKIVSRLYMDADGNQDLRVTVNRDGKINGVSHFGIQDNITQYIDDYQLLNDDAAFNFSWKREDFVSAGSGIYDSTKITTRTFVDRNQVRLLAVQVDRDDKVPTITKFINAGGETQREEAYRLFAPIALSDDMKVFWSVPTGSPAGTEAAPPAGSEHTSTIFYENSHRSYAHGFEENRLTTLQIYDYVQNPEEGEILDKIRAFNVRGADVDAPAQLMDDELASETYFDLYGAKQLLVVNYSEEVPRSVVLSHNQKIANAETANIDFQAEYDISDADFWNSFKTSSNLNAASQRTRQWRDSVLEAGLTSAWKRLTTTYYDRLGEEVLYSYSYQGLDTDNNGSIDQNALTGMTLFQYQTDDASTPAVNESRRLDRQVFYGVRGSGADASTFDANPNNRTESALSSSMISDDKKLTEQLFDISGRRIMYNVNYDDAERLVGYTFNHYRTDDGATISDESKTIESSRQYQVKEDSGVDSAIAVKDRTETNLLSKIGNDHLNLVSHYNDQGDKVTYASVMNDDDKEIQRNIYEYQAKAPFKVDHIRTYSQGGSAFDPYEDL
ncbi:MAG: hypothetical protein HYZ84_00840, partial [Candidatus Omnitrophica bacterium]|nr:hypothetical protein [Candidatus Omnitrophota bacterium]